MSEILGSSWHKVIIPNNLFLESVVTTYVCIYVQISQTVALKDGQFHIFLKESAKDEGILHIYPINKKL
jgi:hypothetical protein